MDGRPLPVVDDVDTGPFFEAAKRHELVVQMCSRCGAVLHLPRAYCQDCGSWDTRWQVTNGRGRVYSWTVAEHQVLASMAVPYTIVLVELEEYPTARFLGYMSGDVDLEVGEPMQVWFEELADGVVLPQWERTRSD
jgi:uncharacterized OB-fold protein